MAIINSTIDPVNEIMRVNSDTEPLKWYINNIGEIVVVLYKTFSETK